MMDYYSILMNLSLETSTSSTTVRGDYALNQRYQVKMAKSQGGRGEIIVLARRPDYHILS